MESTMSLVGEASAPPGASGNPTLSVTTALEIAGVSTRV